LFQLFQVVQGELGHVAFAQAADEFQLRLVVLVGPGGGGDQAQAQDGER